MIKKNLDYYMSLPYKVEIIPDPDGGYAARLPELRGCITCADTWEELQFMIEDAKKAWIQCSLECGDPIPEPMSLEKQHNSSFIKPVSIFCWRVLLLFLLYNKVGERKWTLKNIDIFIV